jgi:hypothetical protein
MELTLIYLAGISAIFAGLLLVRVFPLLAAFYESHVAAFMLRHIVYPYLYRRLPFLPITRSRALLLAIYIGLTAFCNVYGVFSTEQASVRAGWLSIVNLVPLLVTGRLTVAMQALGLSLQETILAHGATGFMFTSQTLAHIVLQLKNSAVDIEKQEIIAGVIVSELGRSGLRLIYRTGRSDSWGLHRNISYPQTLIRDFLEGSHALTDHHHHSSGMATHQNQDLRSTSLHIHSTYRICNPSVDTRSLRSVSAPGTKTGL